MQHLLPEDRTWSFVANEIMIEQMRLIATPNLYSDLIRGFEPRVYPGILSSYGHIFSSIMQHLGSYADSRIPEESDPLCLGFCGSASVVERLTNICFTGDPRFMNTALWNHLRLNESAERAGFPPVACERPAEKSRNVLSSTRYITEGDLHTARHGREEPAIQPRYKRT